MTFVLALEGVSKHFGDIIAVDQLTFSVEQGETIAILGPSGCGKTTTLRLIAGFEVPNQGTIKMSGVEISKRRPYERNVGLLFQDYALFPHMTVSQNVAYGLRFRGVSDGQMRRRTREMLELVSLTGTESRKPSQLSGGQQQRVALARALATSPQIVLLDEPLSALDAKLRQELRVQLKGILSAVGATTIVVTHDQVEAMSLSDRMIVMNAGIIAQEGTPSEIYLCPNNRFVADFVGQANWFAGDFGRQIDDKGVEFNTNAGVRLVVPYPKGNRHFAVCVRPERLMVQRGIRHDWGREGHANLMSGHICDAAYLGPDANLIVEISGGQKLLVIEKNVGGAISKPGDPVQLCFYSSDCILVPD